MRRRGPGCGSSPAGSHFAAARVPVQVWTSSPPVRYRNRFGHPEVWSASLPGTCYCGAFLNASSEYASAGDGQDAASDAADAADAADGGGVPLWGWLLVALVVLVPVLVLLTRRTVRR